MPVGSSRALNPRARAITIAAMSAWTARSESAPPRNQVSFLINSSRPFQASFHAYRLDGRYFDCPCLFVEHPRHHYLLRGEFGRRLLVAQLQHTAAIEERKRIAP